MKACRVVWTAIAATIFLSSQSVGADQSIQRGRYLAVEGDCAPCHTRPQGSPFAGGRALRSGANVIYSLNITPDHETGIGNWSAGDFYRALHDGISPQLGYLYPAFPYPHFRIVSRSDSDDLFAYLKTLKPVHYRPPPDRVQFPMNIRPAMMLWDAFFLSNEAIKPDPARSSMWNRGLAIVRGLGHCGDCHTPKNALFAEETGKRLQGATVEGWFAPDLTPAPRSGLGGWSAQDIEQFLGTGRNAHEWVVGSMREVVLNSTSRLTDADRAAIATYLKSLPPKATPRLIAPDPKAMQAGRAVYVQHCAICHGESGKAQDFPSLAGNTLVQAEKPATLLRVILRGSQSIPVPREGSGFSMPAFETLSDAEIADVATYIRNAWGNRGNAVDPSDVPRRNGT